MTNRRSFDIPKALRNGIRVTFLMLDEALCEIERLAQGRPVESVLHQEADTLSAEQKARLGQSVNRMREAIRDVRQTLKLRPEKLDSRDAIRSIGSVMWQRLADTESRRLRRYGSVPTDLADYLDPIVKSLSDQTREILDCIRGEDGDKTDH